MLTDANMGPSPVSVLVRLEKRFGDHVVPDNVSRAVNAGQGVARIGPSGAGEHAPALHQRLGAAHLRNHHGRPGHDPGDADPKAKDLMALRARVGMVFSRSTHSRT
jgi:ABC-type polar amino acid transport system ATPase subunit